MKPDTKFAFNRKRPTVIRHIKQLLPDGRFLGHLLRNGNVDLITRPENWSDVRGVIKVSFTGTRDGLTAHQEGTFERVIEVFRPSLFTHGDCVGADLDAHNLIIMLLECGAVDCAINTYPSNLESMRAFTGEKYAVREPSPPLERNPLIVNAGQLLIACPGEVLERLRSGTWSTIRGARKTDRLVILIAPDGQILNASVKDKFSDIGYLF